MQINNSNQKHIDRIIKICGMRDADNVHHVAALTPMLMGFIFYEKSPRNALGIDPNIVKSLPSFVNPVGVFVNASITEIQNTTSKYGINIVQLHGMESPEFCAELRSQGLTVIKSIPVDDDINWDDYAPYQQCVDMFICDTRCESEGGSGRKFNWEVMQKYPLGIPYLLSGGIGPDDVDNIIDAMLPDMRGIDINSRFETEPGVKDLRKLIKFILALRKFNENDQTAKPFWEKK